MKKEVLINGITREQVLEYFDKLIEARETQYLALQWGDSAWQKSYAYRDAHEEIFVHDLEPLLESVGLKVYRRKWALDDYWIDAYDYRDYTFADIAGAVKEEEK